MCSFKEILLSWKHAITYKMKYLWTSKLLVTSSVWKGMYVYTYVWMKDQVACIWAVSVIIQFCLLIHHHQPCSLAAAGCWLPNGGLKQFKRFLGCPQTKACCLISFSVQGEQNQQVCKTELAALKSVASGEVLVPPVSAFPMGVWLLASHQEVFSDWQDFSTSSFTCRFYLWVLWAHKVKTQTANWGLFPRISMWSL